ncbi:hypothetical protein [Streptomyces sp. AK02-04a]|uniref:hypothetical protein n=1 Tax=Streptomyces sp. AK02-04a TaxID=3028649 RepID=UPI0029A66095|nr:hypothetical protein [Streptomyces sp. AK02-04a]MDX3764065.1 hypothetical protein [Streptomyces sp. AK02-04a]
MKTYAIELVDNGGYKITDLELSDSTYGGIRSLAAGTYGHKYLWIQNVFFHDITAKHTDFYMLPCSTRPTPPCYHGSDKQRFAIGILLKGQGDGHSTILSDVTVKDCTFLRTDTGFDMSPRGETNRGKTNHGMWRNVNISDSTFTQLYGTGGIVLAFVTGGTTSHVLVDQAGYQVGIWFGNAAFQAVGLRYYTVRDSEFRNTGRPHNTSDGEGLDFESDNRHLTLRDSYIHDNAGPAILFRGNNGAHYPGQNSDLVVENNRIENNNRTKEGIGPTDEGGNNVFLAHHGDLIFGLPAENAGVVRNNIIRLQTNGQEFNPSPVIFEPNNRVYNHDGAEVFRGPTGTTPTDKFAYHGAWRTTNDNNCFRSHSQVSATTGAAYDASFNGSQATLYAPVGPGNGIAGVSVDGGNEVAIDTYSSQADCSRPAFTTRVLPYGHHTIRVRVTGQKNEAASATTIGTNMLAYARQVNATTNDTGFAYHGNWSYGPGNGCYLGDVHWTNQTNASYTIPFNGTRITLHASRHPWNGIAGISIDGGPERLVDLYASAPACDQKVWTSPRLSPGSHTLRVRVTGRHNPASHNTTISADRITVTP